MNRLTATVPLTFFFTVMVGATMATFLFPLEEWASKRLWVIVITAGWGIFFASFLGYMTLLAKEVIREIRR